MTKKRLKHKHLSKLHNLYLFYFLFFAGAFWGIASYFILGFIYHVAEKSFLFWIPALTVFLPGLIAVAIHGLQGVKNIMIFSALYGVILALLLAFVLSLLQKSAKIRRAL